MSLARRVFNFAWEMSGIRVFGNDGGAKLRYENRTRCGRRVICMSLRVKSDEDVLQNFSCHVDDDAYTLI